MVCRARRQVNEREYKDGLQSIGKELRLRSNHPNVPNPSCKYRVPKFQAKPTSSNNVMLDCLTAPSAAVDCHSLWGFADAVKPASPNPVGTVVENPNRVERILGGYQHPITAVEFAFSDLFKRGRSPG